MLLNYFNNNLLKKIGYINSALLLGGKQLYNKISSYMLKLIIRVLKTNTNVCISYIKYNRLHLDWEILLVISKDRIMRESEWAFFYSTMGHFEITFWLTRRKYHNSFWLNICILLKIKFNFPNFTTWVNLVFVRSLDRCKFKMFSSCDHIAFGLS